jgi:hypothetical protein
VSDTSTDAVKPDGAAPVGDGGPHVGPYLTAARNSVLTFAGAGAVRSRLRRTPAPCLRRSRAGEPNRRFVADGHEYHVCRISRPCERRGCHIQRKPSRRIHLRWVERSSRPFLLELRWHN